MTKALRKEEILRAVEDVLAAIPGWATADMIWHDFTSGLFRGKSLSAVVALTGVPVTRAEVMGALCRGQTQRRIKVSGKSNGVNCYYLTGRKPSPPEPSANEPTPTPEAVTPARPSGDSAETRTATELAKEDLQDLLSLLGLPKGSKKHAVMERIRELLVVGRHNAARAEGQIFELRMVIDRLLDRSAGSVR